MRQKTSILITLTFQLGQWRLLSNWYMSLNPAVPYIDRNAIRGFASFLERAKSCIVDIDIPSQLRNVPLYSATPMPFLIPDTVLREDSWSDIPIQIWGNIWTFESKHQSRYILARPRECKWAISLFQLPIQDHILSLFLELSRPISSAR